MEINIGMDGDVVIMKLDGDLVANTAEQLKGQVAKLTEKNFVHIVMDMGKVNFMDSSGLGSCMAVHKQLRDKNGMLVCARLSEPVGKVFRLTRADQKLKVAPNVSDGINLLFVKMKENK